MHGDDTSDDTESHHEAEPLEPLPRKTRLLLWVFGTALVFLGVLGLFLPILQGVLFLILGAALLSVASQGFFRRLQRGLRRWPKLAARVDRARIRLHRRFGRNHQPPRPRERE